MNRSLSLVIAFILLGVSAAVGQNLWGTTSSGASDNKGVLYKTNSDGTVYTVMHNFVTDFPGASPQGALTLAANGKLYGMTINGGTNDQGVLFEYDPVGATYVIKVDFSGTNGAYPQGGLVLASNNKLYGMTRTGGANDLGIIFEFDPAGAGTFTKLQDLTSATGVYPTGNFIQASGNSKLYGLTSAGGANGGGTLIEYTIGGALVDKYDFSFSTGGLPLGDLTEAGGMLYGMTYLGGSSGFGILFEYTPGTTIVTKKIDFDGTNGAYPYGSLTLGNNSNLYGMTPGGGSNGTGLLFEYVPGSTSVTKMVDFTGPNGTTPYGSLFKRAGGLMYGMTFGGGATNDGTLFEYDVTSSTLTKKVDFSLAANGGNPQSSLVEKSGLLYGMTPYGPGASGVGIIFSYDPSTPAITTKVVFSNSINGSTPQSGVVSVGTKLYGMTYAGGVNGQGVIYEFNPAGSVYIKKADFDGASIGANPSGSMVQSGSTLFGLTSTGGANGDGVLFEYDPGTTNVSNRYNFSASTTGNNPRGSLVLASDGLLYGLTLGGGAAGHGVLFSFDPASINAPVIKFSFPAISDGIYPNGSLIQAANGKLYGTTNQGGSNGFGVIFEYDLIAGYTKKFDFTDANGKYPSGDLVQASNGKLYGMTQNGGTSSAGVIYEFDPYAVSPALAVRYSFNGTSGSDPLGNLAEVAPGKLYGTTSQGGASSNGVLFEFDYGTSGFVNKKDFGGTNGMSPQFGSLLLTPSKTVQTITFNSLPSKTVTDAPFSISASASSGLAIIFTSSDPSIASISGNMVTIHQAGTITISASQFGNGTYRYAQDVKRSLVITKSAQTITFTVPSKVYGDAAFDLNNTGSASSGLPLSYVSADPTIASISGSIVTILKAGTVDITASQPGNATYDAAPDVHASLFIDKKNQTIFFTTIPTRTFGDVPFSLSAIADSNLPVSFTDLGPDVSVISLTGNMVTILKAGSTTIRATQAGDGNYYPAAPAQNLLTVNKASQTINLPLTDLRHFGDAPYTLPATTDKGLAISYVSNNASIASISAGNTVTINGVSAPGSIVITADQPGDADHYFAAPQVQQTLTVNKGNQTITFAALPSKGTTDPDFALTATASSGLTVSYVSGNTAVATIVGGNTIHIVGPGTSVITASQAGDLHYNAATDVPQTLTVTTKQPQTITFNPLPGKAMGDAPFNLSATATSSLAVTFSSGNTGIATISGNTLTIVGAGTVTITANQTGDANFFAAAPVTQDMVVIKGNQTITFVAPPSPTEGGAAFTFSGTASSGLALSYSEFSTGKLTISGTTGTPLKAGLATVRASQAGSASYNAAVPVDQTFCIKPAKPVITVTDATTNAPILNSSSPVGNIWLLNGTPIVGATNTTHTVIKAGSYTLIVTIEGCLSDASAPQAIVITGDLPLVAGEVTLYPNPAKERLFVDLTDFEASPIELKIIDLSGRNVHQQRATGGRVLEVSIVDQVPGVYILTVSQGLKLVKSKFVKN